MAGMRLKKSGNTRLIEGGRYNVNLRWNGTPTVELHEQTIDTWVVLAGGATVNTGYRGEGRRARAQHGRVSRHQAGRCVLPPVELLPRLQPGLARHLLAEHPLGRQLCEVSSGLMPVHGLGVRVRAESMNRSTWRNLGVVAAGVAVMAAVATLSNRRRAGAGATTARRVPVFEVDPAWPKLPNNWVLGHVASVAVDQPRSRLDAAPAEHDARGRSASQRGAAGARVRRDGKFVNAWGGPGPGFDWPDSEHGISVDYKDNVWIGGSAPSRTSLRNARRRHAAEVRQQGEVPAADRRARSVSKGNADTKTVHQPADVFVWPKTNERSSPTATATAA